MRIIAKGTIRDFWDKNPNSEQALLSWYKIARKAEWKNFNEVKEQFGSCKIIGHERIIFKIKGNNYRLVIKITFTNQIVWIRFIGSHEEYDSINAKTI